MDGPPAVHRAARTAAGQDPVRGFLLLHGWQNRRPAGHWQHWLAEQLRTDGHQVRYPQLPDPDTPDLGVCLNVLAAEVEQLRRARPNEIVVVCHSLACALWLHAVTNPDRHGLPVDRVLLVAPPSPRFTADHPEISQFTPPPLTAAQLAAAAPGGTRLVAADDDPYCPEGAATAHPVLRDDVDLLLGAGHLDLDAGYGPWPAVLAWCQDPAARFTRTPGLPDRAGAATGAGTRGSSA